MSLKFDASQAHQLAAIHAVDAVFHGQAADIAAGASTLRDDDAIIVGNSLILSADEVLANLRDVQVSQGLPPSDGVGSRLDLTVEMETGTGKTYTYLRTIHHLYRTRGLRKFVVVTPSVAIREGVAKFENMTRSHFASLFGPDRATFRVYDSSRPSLIRQFATSDRAEILLIGLDSFNRVSNLMFQEAEALDYSRPIDLISSCMPVVILDEPQNMEGDAARLAISRLRPLIVLRYSATHREVVNPIYRLGPVQAYERGLVKKVDVLSVTDAMTGAARIELVSVDVRPHSPPRAVAKIWVKTAAGVTQKSIRLSVNDDLRDLSGGRDEYRGYVVSRVDGGRSAIHFANGTSIRAGERYGVDLAAIQRAQIAETIREHLERELLHREHELPLKVLSVFFIDRVARYAASEGDIRTHFVQAYKELAAEPRFAGLHLPSVEHVHRGYFASRRGVAVDTTGDSKADRDTYELIMRDKERLLSLSEPTRFIFSHSALREGWDNPNVFQICTLNQTKSSLKKRQEIGRGLRLPVLDDGSRCVDPNIARLTVVANESYEEFARELQREFEEDCGESFHGTTNRRELIDINLIDGWRQSPLLRKLWRGISREATYSVVLDEEALIREAADSVKHLDVEEGRSVVSTKASLDIGTQGVVPVVSAISTSARETSRAGSDIRSLLTALHARTGVTRDALLRVLQTSGRTRELLEYRRSVWDRLAEEINGAVARVILDGLNYTQTRTAKPLALLERPGRAIASKTVVSTKSLYDRTPWQSEVERDFAVGLEARQDVKYYIKLPQAYTVSTVLGPHTPDWAIVLDRNGEEVVVIAETKGDPSQLQLREAEWMKIRCAEDHYRALGVEYRVLSSISNL
ncbi:DEAD/DEAH box helicase family protein [Geodermatophilus sp. YIM 151500]|uniref:restriction endonuclease n=1 Tax=Geodermatophilus sp. YIM 151500 TaxID=2984531 RepID=UPI0021E4CEF7|nr:DEAD/DEAH box helicase family protein [Geodermatophilus sp. YIM 151500]MCV2488250.1 DEAD/DEAH box helicase family protein [Geodermatophilus sp. YIM 151500]